MRHLARFTGITSSLGLIFTCLICETLSILIAVCIGFLIIAAISIWVELSTRALLDYEESMEELDLDYQEAMEELDVEFPGSWAFFVGG